MRVSNLSLSFKIKELMYMSACLHVCKYTCMYMNHMYVWYARRPDREGHMVLRIGPLEE